MAIVMNAPTYVARLKNPVEQWLQNFDSEMGFTEPRLNGIPIMDDDALNPGKMVSAKAHLKCNLNLPEISAWKEAEAEDEFSDEVWVGEVSRRPINTFDWTVTLPPRGPWRVEMVSGLDASRLVGKVFLEMAKTGNPPDSALKEKLVLIQPQQSWTIEAVVDQGIDTLITHTIAHENQHVADHRAIIKTILGPWDDFIDPEQSYLATKRLKSDSESSVKSQFYTALGYDSRNPRVALAPTGVLSIIQTIHFEFVQSGIIYHKTAAGSACRRRVRSIRTDGPGRVITIELSALSYLQGSRGTLPHPVWDSSRVKFPLR